MVWPAERGQEPVAILTAELDATKPVLVRVHSECLTGDAFGSLRCDCCIQKEEALKQIAESGNGVFIYLRQEGRGMGLFDKIRSYKLQEEGVDTHQASILLGHEPDSREYSWAKKILDALGIKKIKLLTNNPAKVSEIFDAGVEVEKVPLIIAPNRHNEQYFDTKRKKFKHTFGEQEQYHYYGITYTDSTVDIEPLLNHLKTKRRHPLLKIHIGLYVDHDRLENEVSVRALNSLFARIAREQDVIPVVHYSSKGSTDSAADIVKIHDLFPEIVSIQINDVSSGYVEALVLASMHFTCIAPLSDDNFELIDDSVFREVVFRNSSFILLDNSKGTGRAESFELLQEKIGRCLNYGLNNIALAGGFGPGSLDNYFRVRNYYKIDFSIDAESKLHTDDKLNLTKTEAYFDELLHG